MAAAIAILPVFLAAEEQQRKKRFTKKITLKVFGANAWGGSPASIVAFEFMKEHPNVSIENWTSLRIKGGLGWDSIKLMAFAGKTAPDVLHMWFHQVGYYVEQGFLYPLNEYIGEDLNGDGLIDKKDWQDVNGNGKIDADDKGLIWEEWLTIDPYYRRVATVPDKHGVPKIYALPYGDYNLGLLYRLDSVRQAGLDPKKQPQTWDELFYWLQRMTDPKAETGGTTSGQGIWGFGGRKDAQAVWEFQPWFWASGGDLVRIGKKNPKTGKTHWWAKEEMYFIDPETGESLATQPTLWKANFASPESMQALDFLWKMRWQRWIKHPTTKEPINLTDEEAERGWVADPKTGQKIRFTNDDVIEGVMRTYRSIDDVPAYRFFDEGKVACVFGGLGGYLTNLGTNPANVGFMPFPAGPHGKKALFRTPNWKGLNSLLSEDKEKREAAWLYMRELCMERGQNIMTRLSVEDGNARYLFPEQLKKAGLDEYIEEIPKHWRIGYEDVFKYGRTEPFTRFWQPVLSDYMGNKLMVLLLTKRDFDYRAVADKMQQEANINFFDPRDKLIPYRPMAWKILIGALVALLAIIAFMLRLMSQKVKKEGMGAFKELVGSKTVGARFAPWLMLAPAILIVLVFMYYPLLRGALMALQDYKITEPSKFVGPDNFIKVFLDKSFFTYLKRTFEFSAITLLLGFLSPIILAIILSEIPVGKVFFRVVFYLPTISSGVIIMLIWTLMYEPTQYGFINEIIAGIRSGLDYIGVDKLAAFFHWSSAAEWLQSRKPFEFDWLGSNATAMICVIIPAVWMSMGASCLIYLAALKTVPDDLYDAASIDGAGIFGRLRHVTLPMLKPLIIINFVGAFIGTFLSMGLIFVMTGGGPGDRTMVLSLAIWFRAFAYLQFGVATAMAWVLGGLLIGFTVYQLRFLQKVEFRRLEEN